MSGKYFYQRYLISEKLGEGGFSVVYKAFDTIDNIHVVIKFLKPQMMKNDAIVENFKKEATDAVNLDHPCIVKTHYWAEDDGKLFVVMDYIEGRSIKHILGLNESLPVEFVVSVIKKICLALEYVHSKGILHCDIKPENIIIDKEGNPFLTDFLFEGSADDLSSENSVKGSVYYISPEQAKGDKLDLRTDIYSLGITMFEMLTGKVPFTGETSMEIALKHLHEDLPVDSIMDKSIPDSLKYIILKCTQKNKVQRYRSALLLYKDLDLCLSEPDGSYVKLEKKLKHKKAADKEKAKKHKRAAVLIVIAIIVVAVSLLLFSIHYFNGNIDNDIKVPQVTGITEEEAKELLQSNDLVPEIEYAYNDEIAEGVVITQSPAASVSVKAADTVKLIVSNGTEESLEMPDVLNLQLEEAETRLAMMNINKYEIVEELVTDQNLNGCVIKQVPEPDSVVYKDDVIVLTIGRIE